MMTFINLVYQQQGESKISFSNMKTFLQLLCPFAPHLCEELGERMGEKGFLSLKEWPTYDPSLIAVDTIHLPIQVMGKMRGTLEIEKVLGEEPGAEEKILERARKELASVERVLKGKQVVKLIYKPQKILNIILRN